LILDANLLSILASTDQDFRRFPGLRWIDPLGE
jgi:hypothetical protein